MSERKIGDTVYYLDSNGFNGDYIRKATIVVMEAGWLGDGMVYKLAVEPNGDENFAHERFAYDSVRECALASLARATRSLEDGNAKKAQTEAVLSYLQNEVELNTMVCHRTAVDISMQEGIIRAMNAALAESNE